MATAFIIAVVKVRLLVDGVVVFVGDPRIGVLPRGRTEPLKIEESSIELLVLLSGSYQTISAIGYGSTEASIGNDILLLVEVFVSVGI